MEVTSDIDLIDTCANESYTITQSPVIGTGLADGIHTITVSVTDINNNTANCTFLLEVDLIPI